jgi:hypothetical protein
MPFYRFQLDVTLKPEAVAERLRSIVRKPRGFVESFRDVFKSKDPADCPFLGSVEVDSFRIRRDIKYRNSFLPQVRGTIIPASNGSAVNITMFMHPITALFMVVWFMGVGAGAVGIVAAQGASGAMASVPFAMFVFGVALVAGGFFPEAFKAKRILSEALGAEPA